MEATPGCLVLQCNGVLLSSSVRELCTRVQVLHGSTTMTEAIRRAVQSFAPLDSNQCQMGILTFYYSLYLGKQMLFSHVNSALYTSTFSWANVLAQRAYLVAARAVQSRREFRTYFGDSIRGDISDFIQARIFSFGIWEPNLSRFVESRIKSDTWAIDIGAHIGYFTLLISSLAPQGRVTAIEASPSTFQQLSEHLSINSRRNVNAVNKAVAAVTGDVRLYNSKWGAGNTGNNSLIAPETPTACSVVPADTLMNIIGDDAKRISFIKIDVEGAERPILEEILMHQGAFADSLTVVAEVSDANLDLVGRFLSAGFKCSVLENFYGLDAYLSKRQEKPKPWAGTRHPSADLIFERL